MHCILNSYCITKPFAIRFSKSETLKNVYNEAYKSLFPTNL